MLRHPSICPQSPALLSAPSRCGGQKIYLCGPADELLRASICLCQRGPDKSRRAPRTRLRSKSKISAVFTDGDYEPCVSEVRLCSESLGYKCLSIAHTPGRLSALTWGRPAEGGGGRRCNRLLHRYAIGIRLQSGAIYPAVRRCNHDPGLFFFFFYLPFILRCRQLAAIGGGSRLQRQFSTLAMADNVSSVIPQEASAAPAAAVVMNVSNTSVNLGK